MTEQNNYNKTIFYKIVCKDENIHDKYVGHTSNFRNRSSEHKTRCYNQNSKHYNLPLYRFMRQNGGFDNLKIAIIEDCSFSNKKDAVAHEGYLVNILEASLNERTPGRTPKEWYEQNEDRQKQFNEQNKDKRKPI